MQQKDSNSRAPSLRARKSRVAWGDERALPRRTRRESCSRAEAMISSAVAGTGSPAPLSVNSGLVCDIVALPGLGRDCPRPAVHAAAQPSRLALRATRRARRRGARRVLTGRVEMWRGGGRTVSTVTAPFVWRCRNRRSVTPFPHPAHRTGQADFPHPALGRGVMFTPTGSCAAPPAAAPDQARVRATDWSTVWPRDASYATIGGAEWWCTDRSTGTPE